MDTLYIGLISGTSLDGIDAVLVDLDGDTLRLAGTHYRPYDPELRQALHNLCRDPQTALACYADLDVRLGRLFAETALQLLDKHDTPTDAVRAIGSHGQSVLHRPEGSYPTSLQLADPNIIAEHTGITVIADFRRRDMAAGGQGAPLVPAFHAAMFASRDRDRAILNIGGIANLTILPADNGSPVTGWDTGPGNTLMDAWILRQQGRHHDSAGQWASQGTVNQALLDAALADPYFALPPPKSTGPEYFNLAWLDALLAASRPAPDPADTQATLCELTAASIEQALADHAPGCDEILVCGGGVHNDTLMARLKERLLPKTLRSTSAYGLDPDWVEASAFAWLARQTLEGKPGNLHSVTGASHPVVLGGIYPGMGN